MRELNAYLGDSSTPRAASIATPEKQVVSVPILPYRQIPLPPIPGIAPIDVVDGYQEPMEWDSDVEVEIQADAEAQGNGNSEQVRPRRLVDQGAVPRLSVAQAPGTGEARLPRNARSRRQGRRRPINPR